MQNLKENFSKFVTGYVMFVQKILLYILLGIIYYIGFGITKMLAFFLSRKLLYEEKNWQKAKQNNFDIHKPY